MKLIYLIVYSISVTLSQSELVNNSDELNVRKFPDGFLFGTATAAYQIEGGWNEDGKTESIWDYLVHTRPNAVKDRSNGDVASDSYHQYKRDVEMTRELGIDFYRFSISWPRILPTSFPDKINKAGVDYYNNLINELLKYNIEPVVTLYHWDLPQTLQEMGGWTNPYIVDWFGDYAKVVFQLFGDRVKHFITINEPFQVCSHGYGDKTKAPMLNLKGQAEYLCAKNILLAHARAWHIYHDEFRNQQGGKLFMSFSCQWYEPATQTQSDVEGAHDANMFFWGLYTHPIFSKTGDYPQVVKDRVAARSAAQGYPRSRLPALTPEEVNYIRGTSDVFGLNHYFSYLVYRNETVTGYHPSPSYLDDMEVIIYQKPEWKIGSSNFSKYTPWGFTKLLLKLKEEYDNPPVYITENGFSSGPGYDDRNRITYVNGYLNAMLDAIDEGCDIRAYTIWSLMDNFEWLRGYRERFGLYEVDYNSLRRARTPRKSAFVFKHIVRTRSLDLNYHPNTTVMTIDDGSGVWSGLIFCWSALFCSGLALYTLN